MQNDKDKVTNVRRTHLGRYLFEINKAYQKITMAYIQRNGFPEMTLGHLHVLSQIDLHRGIDTGELIFRVGTSKQAVSRILMSCEKFGYIDRETSSEDARSRMIRFDRRGLELMKVAAQATVLGEAEFSKKMGKEKFKKTKELLEELFTTLDLPNVDD